MSSEGMRHRMPSDVTPSSSQSRSHTRMLVPASEKPEPLNVSSAPPVTLTCRGETADMANVPPSSKGSAGAPMAAPNGCHNETRCCPLRGGNEMQSKLTVLPSNPSELSSGAHSVLPMLTTLRLGGTAKPLPNNRTRH
eukprot:7382589-Prymnesium_polylepis.3